MTRASIFALAALALLCSRPARSEDVNVLGEQWYRGQIDTAEFECKTAKTRLEEARKLLAEAKVLLAKAPAGDLAGRGVARQADWKARSAISKNNLRKKRACGKVERLRDWRGAAIDGTSAMPTVAQGDVRIETDKGFVPWDGKTPLKPGQGLRTGSDGFAEIMFSKSPEVLRIGPNSEFELEKDGPALKKGAFDYFKDVKEKLNETSATYYGHRISVGGVIATIRGTRFAALVKPKGLSTLALMEGQLALTETKGGKEILLEAGQQVQFQDGKIARGPEAVDPAAFQKAWGKQ